MSSPSVTRIVFDKLLSMEAKLFLGLWTVAAGKETPECIRIIGLHETCQRHMVALKPRGAFEIVIKSVMEVNLNVK